MPNRTSVECYGRDGKFIASPLLLQEIYSLSYRTFTSFVERVLIQAAISICSKLKIPIPDGVINIEKKKALIGNDEYPIDRNVFLMLFIGIAIIDLDLEPAFPSVISAWDWLNKPVVYIFPHPQNIFNKLHRYTSDVQQSQWSSDISISQCEFSISQVKLLYGDDPASEGTTSLEYGNLVQFQIIIRHNSQRIETWRTYDEIYSIFIEVGKHFTKNRSVQMTSVKKLLKQARKIETSRDGILNNDHKEFQGESNIGDIFEMPILQRLQSDVLAWLKSVQSDITLCDNDSIRQLLRMPVYAPTHLPAHMIQSPATESLRRHHWNLSNSNTTAKVQPNPTATTNTTTTTNSVSSTGAEIVTKARAVSFEKSNPIVIPAQQANTGILSSNPVVITAVDVIAEEYENDAEVLSADGMSKGCRIHNFIFLDQSPAARSLYHDCSYSHSFKVRGLSYLTDKKKIDAGPAVMKLMFM
eukprot:gene25616-33451_t